MSQRATHVVTPASTWAPFAHSAFALLWTATLVSNIGAWVHNAGAAWLAVPAALLGGLGWIAVLTSLNVSAQTALPNWVQ